MMLYPNGRHVMFLTLLLQYATNYGCCITLQVYPGTNLTEVVSSNCSSQETYSDGSGYVEWTDCEILLYTNLLIDSPIMFLHLNSTSVYGVDSVMSLICSSRNAGLIFSSTAHVELRNLKIVSCATIKTYYTGASQAELFSSALHIVLTQYVSMCNVTIAGSPGAGMLLVQNSGITNITNCSFARNQLDQPSVENVVGGGGVYLHIASTDPYSKFQFTNCTFHDNVAANTVNYSYLFVDEFGEPVIGRGRGGGIFINMQSNVTHNSVLLTGCRFADNTGFLGSGMSAEIEYGDSQNNIIHVTDSEFVRNGCTESPRGSGGGAQLSFRTFNTNTNKGNTIFFQNVTFRENCALLGGGTYFFSNLDANPNTNNQIIFDNCTWLGNYARTGSAVDITPDIFERLDSGYGSVPIFRDCIFTNNSVVKTMSAQQYGTGTLYSSLYDIRFELSAEFSHNNGTAVNMVNAVANFSNSSALFDSNRGIQGGGVALIGTSSMLIGPHNYSFINNIATDKGGAIYSYLVDSHDFIVSRSCFLQYIERDGRRGVPSTQWKARVHFEGNIARSDHGHDIFTSSLLPCQVVNIAMRNQRVELKVLDVANIFQPPGVTFHDKVRRSISTDGARFTNNSGHIAVIPGEEYRHSVYVLDDLDQVIKSTLAASFRKGSIELDESSTCLTNQIIQLKGSPHKRDTLLLQAINTRRISLTLDVELLNCPPGFRLSENQCVCDDSSHTAIIRCDDSKLLSYLRTGFWAGYVNTSDGELLATVICPVGFCSSERNSSTLAIALPQSRNDLERAMCGIERSGILCGKCNPGYVVHFHSPTLQCEAENCNHVGWLLYILSEIIPATILFIVILTFNISFTSGALNGFILFSQVLDSLLIDGSGVIVFPDGVKDAVEVIQLVYGFFNLNFFYHRRLSFCIWKEASVLDILGFKYLTIVYSIFLIAGVIVFMKHCGARCLGRYYRVSVFRNSVIQGLSTFLVMCYAQCIKVSFDLLYFGTLHLSPAETNITLPRRVWFNGELEFFSPEHLRYALPALIVLLVIGVIPPAILLTYPAIFRISSCLKIRDAYIDKCLPSYNTMKPFLDAFQGSFKDNFRFFAGLYFLYRWVGVFIYAVITSYSVFYAALEVILVLMLVLHALCQPYLKKWHNVLDTFLLADLALINNLTAVHYYASRVDTGQMYQNNIDRSTILQVILIYLPVLYLISYVLVQVIKKTCSKKELINDRVRNFFKQKHDNSQLELQDKLIENHTSSVLSVNKN